MVKLYTSYFYQIRFFKPYQVPLSTAVWDPKWFHQFQGADNIFFDKRGIINGVRFTHFVPGSGCNTLCHGRESCSYLGESSDCEFLRKYREQLNALDFEEIMSIIKETAGYLQELLRLDRDPEFIFIVYEAENNPCSERRVIQEWFKDHNIDVKEWRPNINDSTSDGCD